MAQRGIREFDAKRMLAYYWSEYMGKDLRYPGQFALVTPETNLDQLEKEHSWLAEGRLVVKPDQLFGKRGKHGLVKIAASLEQAKRWIQSHMNNEATVGQVTDKLTHFLIEPYVPHEQEFYVAIKSERKGDAIYFSNHGGVDIEEVWDTVVTIHVGIGEDITQVDIGPQLPADTPADKRTVLAEFVRGLFKFYVELGYVYLEINPFVVSDGTVTPLDLVARIDDTAHFESGHRWGDLSFPAPFGRKLSEEEKHIKAMDETSGASLKLTVLNPQGRVWTLVAGGGASVVYTDTIVDLSHGAELANYGEYSGNPSTDETYEYTKTLLGLLTREKDHQGRTKVLLIGGGIANFTDVAKTFQGIIMALRDYREKLIKTDVQILVRRGGPNYEQGLKMMYELGKDLSVPIQAFGPETHMTRIVEMALGTEGAR